VRRRDLHQHPQRGGRQADPHGSLDRPGDQEGQDCRKQQVFDGNLDESGA
jgi:hypothetical protein